MKKIYIYILILSYFIFLFSVKAVNTNNNITIYIDAGHGGIDGGAVINNIKESNIVLEIALKIKEVFEDNSINVILSRTTDIDFGGRPFNKKNDILYRINQINNSNAALAISIHLNKFSIEKYRGAQIFYSNINDHNKILATHLKKNIENNLKNTNRQIVCRNNIYLLNKAIIPCCIVECGFMSNKEELALLLTNDYQYKLAHALLYGIQSFIPILI